MANHDNQLTSAPIPGLVRQIAVPASIGFFFNTMYNVVDTYFAGQVSTTALAALSLSFPVFFTIIAIGTGISTGATALIANALGAGEADKARKYAMQALVFMGLAGLVLTVLGIWSAPWLLGRLGASGEYLDLAFSYIRIIFYGTILFGLTFTINAILNAQGDTKTFRNFLVFGFFLNVFLDPALLYGWGPLPALGFSGIAWATFIVQVLGVAYMGWRALRTDLICARCLELIRPDPKYFREIAGQGFPASLNMMTVALGVFIITYFVAPFGEKAVAAYGIATRIDQIAVLPTIGLNIAALSIVGQNNGARRFDRAREAWRVALRYGLWAVALGAVLVFAFPGWIMGRFTADAETIAIGAQYLRICAPLYFGYLVLYLAVSVLQGLKRPFYAIWIGAYRQAVAPLLVFPLLASWLGWGLEGIWWGIFIINWSATGVSYWYVKNKLRGLGTEKVSETP
jgi:putative MATE family efflux protein